MEKGELRGGTGGPHFVIRSLMPHQYWNIWNPQSKDFLGKMFRAHCYNAAHFRFEAILVCHLNVLFS